MTPRLSLETHLLRPGQMNYRDRSSLIRYWFRGVLSVRGTLLCRGWLGTGSAGWLTAVRVVVLFPQGAFSGFGKYH